MLTRDFDYELPAEAIAQQPAPRGASRLLALDRAGAERHRLVADLPALLRPGDLLVVNDTRVIPARLFGRAAAAAPPGSGAGGGAIELLLAERRGELEWDVLCRPGRRARAGAVIEIATREGGAAGITATVMGAAADGRRRVRFSQEIEGQLERLGHVPLPPYIRRADEAADGERYQTVYASRPGAIAAPTAGLHFSPELLAALAESGVERTALTLHVGIGTFKPVTAPLVSDHRMDAERFAVPDAAATALATARAAGRRVVAVGTTVVRTLEAAALAGGGEVRPGAGSTDLFITPGFRFQVVDVLLTNFHLPRSTLLMLVSSFAGRTRVLAAYREALDLGYRFFSYGDAMLAERRRGES